jgi:adenosylcobyric acid synthase
MKQNLKEIGGYESFHVETVFEEEKVNTRVEAECRLLNKSVYGYEIHMGIAHTGKRLSLFSQ